MAQYKAIVMIPHVKKDGCEFSVEPLVLCKDCKHGEQSVLPNRNIWCNIHEFYRKPCWFCADGESKYE